MKFILAVFAVHFLLMMADNTQGAEYVCEKGYDEIRQQYYQHSCVRKETEITRLPCRTFIHGQYQTLKATYCCDPKHEKTDCNELKEPVYADNVG